MNQTNFMLQRQFILWTAKAFNRVICLPLLGAIVFAQVACAEPADLKLTMDTPLRVITGAQVPIHANVYNLAEPGQALDYSLFYTLPDNSVSQTVTGTRAADGGAGFDQWSINFDYTNAPFGLNNFSATATGQAGTLHSPQTANLSILVLNHVLPAIWINGREVDIRESSVPEPQVDPEQFGATGGGESASASAPDVIGDPLVPTANMDLDSVTSIGDSEITTNLGPTSNVVADDSPSSGIPWKIFLTGGVPGHHYTKTLILGFSDEDIPGGSPIDSITARLFLTANVDANNAVTFSVVPLYVPEPGTSTIVIGLFILALRQRRK